MACEYGRTERHNLFVDGNKLLELVFQLQTTSTRRRTEEDRAVGVDSADLFVRSTCVDCRQLRLIYIRVDSGTGLVANWSGTCPTRLETRTNASVHVRESGNVTKGEVKAKSGAFRRKGYHSSLAGGGALPARLCRNVGEAEQERTR